MTFLQSPSPDSSRFLYHRRQHIYICVEVFTEVVDFRVGQNSSTISSGHLSSRLRATRIGSSCGLSTGLILALLLVTSKMRYGPWYGHANL